ncbi:MAG: FAD-dependent oxidoreductase [Candidatus Puniceispirillaceae bacterium]
MPSVITSDSVDAEIEVDCLIIGGGAAGLTAALAASEAGESVLVAERDATLSGSTALSSGLVPAAETVAQAGQSITDSQDAFFDDIMAKNKNSADPDHVRTIVAQIPKTIDWLAQTHGIPFHVLDDFLYPGHSHHRMHAVPEVTGQGLITRLEQAVAHTDTMIVTEAQVTDLILSPDGVCRGARCERPDGARETIAARRIILACNGYGGNPDLVARHIPEMKEALYFGHPGNQGEAIVWGEQIGAVPTHLSGYQGHGSVAHPHGILVTWALMMEGGVQINLDGERFSNEHQGYSEQAVAVLAQPEKTAFNIFDARLCELGRKFEDFRNAEDSGAVITAPSLAELAGRIGVNKTGFEATMKECAALAASGVPDRHGRRFDPVTLLSPPYAAVKVTGALFHTQGGLLVDEHARVRRGDGAVFENLFACGGAACGVSGPDVSGYLSGNGLLTALALGHLAGKFTTQNAGRA